MVSHSVCWDYFSEFGYSLPQRSYLTVFFSKGQYPLSLIFPFVSLPHPGPIVLARPILLTNHGWSQIFWELFNASCGSTGESHCKAIQDAAPTKAELVASLSLQLPLCLSPALSFFRLLSHSHCCCQHSPPSILLLLFGFTIQLLPTTTSFTMLPPSCRPAC